MIIELILIFFLNLEGRIPKLAYHLKRIAEICDQKIFPKKFYIDSKLGEKYIANGKLIHFENLNFTTLATELAQKYHFSAYNLF